MKTGILQGNDFAVAAWVWKKFNLHPMQVNRCFGLLQDGELVGGFMFQHFNGTDVFVSYYGENTLTLGRWRFICQTALDTFKVERVTFHIHRNNKRLAQWLKKMGAHHEGNSRRYYGRDDSSVNTAMRFSIFADQMRRILKRIPAHTESGLALH